MALKPGDVLIDNDPRMKGRKVKIIAIGDSHAICDGAKRVSIDLRRIFHDDKPRRSGFTVRRNSAPDARCVTTPDGGCVGNGCMHDTQTQTGEIDRVR